jgi:hypothetical protein
MKHREHRMEKVRNEKVRREKMIIGIRSARNFELET